MESYDNVVETVKGASEADFSLILTNIVGSMQSGEIMNDPTKLLAVGLFISAGAILLICILAVLFRRSSSHMIGDNTIFMLESRIQALEMALGDQRNLVISIKNQSKADVGYFKQELKNLYAALEDLESDLEPEKSRDPLIVANSY